MPSNKKLLQAAAGNAGSDPLYVEDVFSTYLYDGTGATQVIENGIALGDSNYGSSVEFDGVADYVSKSSGLTGQSDSHTFTLSIWVFNQVSSGFARILGIKNSSGSNNILYLQIDSNNYLNVMTLTDGVSQIQGISASNSPPGYTVPPNQWSNILISANTATSTWHLSINDSYTSVTPYKPSGYTNAIAFSTSSGSTVGTLYGSYFKGRITQLYLDNTFRDLSQTSVRRTFINSDGTPATGLASLNPVLYLPLDDTNSVGTNLGTGGAYSVSGSPTQLSEGGPYIESGFGKGGLVWIKSRNNAGATSSHVLLDTERGADTTTSQLSSDTTSAATTGYLDSYNSDGFTLKSNGGAKYNYIGADYASWTFRKAEKFFDVVTYSSDTTSGARTISHNLGSTPAFIIVKGINFSDAWYVYHISTGVNKYLELNLTGAGHAYTNFWGVTDSTFTVDSFLNNNGLTGKDYVAYLFASDAGGFGDDGDESIIKCGSYVGSGDTAPYVVSVDLGFEPQWLLVKNVTTGGAGKNWLLVDMMRGFHATGADKELRPNTNDAENDSSAFNVTSTGFSSGSGGEPNIQGNTYIYIAIRRPMKTPESGTEVFAAAFGNDSGSSPPTFSLSFTPDAVVGMWDPSSWNGSQWFSRLTGNKRLISSGTAVEGTQTEAQWDYMDGAFDWSNLTNYFAWMFKRATGFFDVVAYTGTGVAGRTVAHNLGVAPELMIVKRRDGVESWSVYSAYNGLGFLFLNTTSAYNSANIFWNNTSPSDSVFTVSGDGGVNVSGGTYIAYLFASLAGVSKVGSYTGTGSNVDVDCGFSAGARFILIKRTDSTGDWYTWDSTRGIVAGNDPYLLMNSATGQVTSTDYIDPLSSGFTVTSSAPAALNASGGTYIFLAIA